MFLGMFYATLGILTGLFFFVLHVILPLLILAAIGIGLIRLLLHR